MLCSSSGAKNHVRRRRTTLRGVATVARVCGISVVEAFDAGLELCGAAVRAVLTLPWNSGQAKGQIDRFKLVKPQRYGRAGFDLLRRRVLMAA